MCPNHGRYDMKCGLMVKMDHLMQNLYRIFSTRNVNFSTQLQIDSVQAYLCNTFSGLLTVKFIEFFRHIFKDDFRVFCM
jgi:hypothetical protein